MSTFTRDARALRMSASGASWLDIAQELGYCCPTAAENAVAFVSKIHERSLANAERVGEKLAGLLAELVAALGHDPKDPQVRKVIAATCRNYS